MTGGKINYLGFSYVLQHASGSADAGRDRVMVAADPDYKLRVIGLTASPGAAGVSVTLKSNATPITSEMESEEGIIQLPINEHGHTETEDGEALNIRVSSGTTQWDLWYIAIPSA